MTAKSRPGDPLTQTQRAILEYIYRVACREGRRATTREMCEEFGMSPNGIYNHLRGLARKDYIRFGARSQRARGGTGRGMSASYDLMRLPDGSPFLGLRPIRLTESMPCRCSMQPGSKADVRKTGRRN